MKKNGFTLVELLAAIAIIAVLTILVLPNVLGFFTNAKKASFENELKQLYEIAENQFSKDFITGGDKFIYTNKSGCSNAKALAQDGRDIDYYIEYNEDGKVVKFYATDGDFQFVNTTLGLRKENVKGAVDVTDGNKITITCSGI